VNTIALSIFAGSRAFCSKKKKTVVRAGEAAGEREGETKWKQVLGRENRPSNRRNRFFERIEVSANVTYGRAAVIVIVWFSNIIVLALCKRCIVLYACLLLVSFLEISILLLFTVKYQSRYLHL